MTPAREPFPRLSRPEHDRSGRDRLGPGLPDAARPPRVSLRQVRAGLEAVPRAEARRARGPPRAGGADAGRRASPRAHARLPRTRPRARGGEPDGGPDGVRGAVLP